MSKSETVQPGENVSILGQAVGWVALAGALVITLSVIVFLVLTGIGGQDKAVEVVEVVGGISLVVASIAALTSQQFWPSTNKGLNEMPDSTQNNGVP